MPVAEEVISYSQDNVGDLRPLRLENHFSDEIDIHHLHHPVVAVAREGRPLNQYRAAFYQPPIGQQQQPGFTDRQLRHKLTDGHITAAKDA